MKLATVSIVPTMRDKEYELGTHDEELQRLALQHQLCRAQASMIRERARFVPGQALLDVGCGPGFATRDLSALVGSSGQVTAVDVSKKFVDHVRSLGLVNVDVRSADVEQLDEAKLPSSHFDGAYC